MGRRIAISLLLLVVVGGAYVWFSLSPAAEVNLEAAANVEAVFARLDAAHAAKLPVSLSGNEVKALAVQAIKTSGLDDRIQGIDIELRQSSMSVALAVEVAGKVVAVSAEAAPSLQDDRLTIDLAGAKVGAVPVPLSEVLKRVGGTLPAGVSLSDNRLTIDLANKTLGQMQLGGLGVENGSLKLQPR